MEGEQLPLWLDLLIVSYRTIILYIVSLTVVRLVGKRSIGQMAPFDLVVIIIIGSVAAIPIEEKRIRVLDAALSIAILGALEYTVATLNMRFRKLEKITQGQSTVLVQDGQILEENLRREKITLADLYIGLRQKDTDDIQDVQLAVLEPDGKVSVIKKKEKQPVTPETIQVLTLNRLDALMVQGIHRARARADDLFEEVGRRSRLRMPP
ncbi:MAG: DUF421 domain-containing protein [Firmicutes bacterium]|nr:DUF421 domain-containing protein [Bacillota bacterium]